MEWFILLHMPLISQNHIKKKTASLKAYRGSAGSFYILTFYVKEKGASISYPFTLLQLLYFYITV